MIISRKSEIDVITDSYVQKSMLQMYWKEFPVTSTAFSINVKGIWKASGYQNKYSFEILYDLQNGKPYCYIMAPYIKPSPSIHLNSNYTLCLYHFREYAFTKKFLLATEIIPWIIEWTLYYELYLINGNIWKGPEAPHC